MTGSKGRWDEAEKEVFRQREGKNVPRFRQKRIEFAPQGRLEAVEHLIPRFFTEVIQRDYRDFMITDLSDLYDILKEDQVETALDRMNEHYLIDSRACRSTRIVDLLVLLHERGVDG